MFDTLFGMEIPLALKIFLALVIVFVLVGIVAWGVRRFGADRFGGGAARGRQPRLAVVDRAAVDTRRSLVIIRRDNVEHLLMIGGPTDVVVESNIVRAMGAPRDRDAPGARPATVPDPLTRPVPLAEGTLWPLQPQADSNQRQTRAAPTEETMQWTSTWERQPEQPPRSPGPDVLSELTEELSAHTAAQRDSGISAARKSAATMMRPAAPPARTPDDPASAALATDRNLAEMAQRLEAALRQPQEVRPAVEKSAKAMPVKVESPQKHPAAPEQRPAREQAKAEPAKSVYDALEEEMANLLGRPPGKP